MSEDSFRLQTKAKLKFCKYTFKLTSSITRHGGHNTFIVMLLMRLIIQTMLIVIKLTKLASFQQIKAVKL